MTDRDRIRALCFEIDQRIGEALERQDGSAYDDVSHLAHELSEIAERLGMRSGPIRLRLAGDRIWLRHSTPEHGSASGFVARDYSDSHDEADDDQWRKVQDSMRRWVRWIDAGFELRTGHFANPIVEQPKSPKQKVERTAEPTYEELQTLRKAIAERSKTLPPDAILAYLRTKGQGMNEGRMRKALRQLEREGEYAGFTRPPPPAKDKS